MAVGVDEGFAGACFVWRGGLLTEEVLREELVVRFCPGESGRDVVGRLLGRFSGWSILL